MADPFDFERPQRYAVMGNPVAHSKSPLIHKQFAQQFKHEVEYSAIQVEPGGFSQAVDQFRASGGAGLNITVPFKLDAFRLAKRLSERGQLAGAVNTFRFENDGEIFGDNTDGAGLLYDLTVNLAVNLRGKQLLVLGAGGAARGVLGPLLKQRPERLVIANRTLGKAKELAQLFARSSEVEARGLDALRGQHFDVVINATAASLKGEVPPLPESLFKRGGIAYDLMYGDKPTAFMEWAHSVGAEQVSDGIGMLVEQAAESYFVWRGVRPQTKPVIALLRQGH